MKEILKKYKLDNLLYEIGNESREMFINDESFTIRYIQSPYKKFNLYQSIWDMVDISYLAICSSNDYKNKILKKDDLVFIVNEYRRYDDDFSKMKMENINEDDTMLYILYGHSQEQFKYQNKILVIEQINRNIELLQYIPKTINNTLNIDSILKEITGFNFKEFNELLFTVCLIGLVTSDITNLTNLSITNTFSHINPIITNENLKKIINFYSSTYKEYRESDLKKHYLKTKPIVKTDNGKLLILNQYLLYNLLEEGAYWIIRNYFASKNSQAFTNEFGLYYEKYLEEMLTYYLNSCQFENLQEDCKSKICDWKIETDKYIIFIEQKSTIASIFTKNMYPDISQIRRYLKKLGEGFKQLEISEKRIKEKRINNDKVVIKLLMHYELLYIPETIEKEIIKSINGDEADYKNTFLVSTSEIERMVYALSKKESLLNEVIDKKIYLEETKDPHGRSFSKILDELSIENDYLQNVKNHYSKMINKYK